MRSARLPRRLREGQRAQGQRSDGEELLYHGGAAQTGGAGAASAPRLCIIGVARKLKASMFCII
jgi:hypothetical protein